MVVTCQALKLHGGIKMERLDRENLAALRRGFDNARVHVENQRKFGAPVVVAINRFNHDTDAELDTVRSLCAGIGVDCEIAEVAHYGGEGGVALARKVIESAEPGNRPFAPLYAAEDSLRSKIETIAREIYRADGVDYDTQAGEALDRLEAEGFGELSVCMAKTQLSLSDDPKRLGAPRGWRLHIRDAKVSAGAGFVVVMTGKTLLMPGMSRKNAAQRIGMDEAGRIYGLS